MKKRIKIDRSILSFAIILTGFLYQFRGVYPKDLFADDILDFVGFLMILTGTYFRMAARGFKKAHSKEGQKLVVEGLYTLVRNPMYLGSFLMGAGFVFLVWPWWTLPLFAALFYARFKKQIIAEEGHLTKLFGKEYEQYIKKVPRLFPRLKSFLNVRVRKVFPLDEVWTTKEKWGLLGWPCLAVLLEFFQEKIVFGFVDFGKIIYICFFAYVTFLITMWAEYQRV